MRKLLALVGILCLMQSSLCASGLILEEAEIFCRAHPCLYDGVTWTPYKADEVSETASALGTVSLVIGATAVFIPLVTIACNRCLDWGAYRFNWMSALRDTGRQNQTKAITTSIDDNTSMLNRVENSLSSISTSLKLLNKGEILPPINISDTALDIVSLDESQERDLNEDEVVVGSFDDDEGFKGD